MTVNSADELVYHFGHSIAVVKIRREEEISNVVIECFTCGEILVDFDRLDGEETEDEKRFFTFLKHITQSLKLILNKECPDKARVILDSLGDATSNNWEELYKEV